MSQSKTYIIRTQLIADNACKAILSNWERMEADHKPMCVEIKRTSRSLEQNKRYWAILHRFSKAVKIGGRHYSAEILHEYFKREFIGITALPNGMPMSKSSADLSVDAFGEYMQQVEAWMIENGASPEILESEMSNEIMQDSVNSDAESAFKRVFEALIDDPSLEDAFDEETGVACALKAIELLKLQRDTHAWMARKHEITMAAALMDDDMGNVDDWLCNGLEGSDLEYQHVEDAQAFYDEQMALLGDIPSA